MNDNQLNRVMRLVRRTGDRCVVLDNENDSAVVVMNLDEYESLLDFDGETCQCCEDHCDSDECINGDDDDDVHSFDDILPDVASEVEEISPKELNDDFYPKEEALHFDAEEIENVAPIMEEMPVELSVEEPKNFANVGQEERLQDLPGEEADRFYLEPVDE